METKRKKRKEVIGILIAILILITIVVISNIKMNNLSFAEGIFNFFVMPIQNGLTYLKNNIEGNSDFTTNINNLKDENIELKKENAKLQETLREFEIVKSENETLKEYVNLKDKYADYKTIPAYVINKDISNFTNTIIINVGSKDGIEVNMAVISGNGLVGHVISVTETTAKVQTIIDTASSISCILTSSRDTIVVKGTLEANSKIKATFIPTEANLMQGDTIETSGIGGIYPKGILVGSISKVVNTKNITDRYALVDTAVNFSKLDTVLVITR